MMMLYLVCSARSCTEDEEAAAKREEQYIMNLKDSVEHVFTSDTLSDQLLRAFEITAIEKLNDFADYLKILSDTALELKFRQHAAELTRDLFVPGEIKLKKWSKMYGIPGLHTLDLLLEHSLAEGISYSIQPSQINIRNPFSSVNDSTCTGVLSFILDSNPLDDQEQSQKVSDTLDIDIYLIKEIKSFGHKQFRVWEVYLGNLSSFN